MCDIFRTLPRDDQVIIMENKHTQCAYVGKIHII